MTEPWLTKRELAAQLKVSPRTVERLHLPAMRVGGRNRYLLSECERYLRLGPPDPKDPPNNVVEFRPRPKATA